MRQQIVLWENVDHEYAVWHFIRYKRVADAVNNTDGKRLLDVGCGIGLQDLLFLNKEIVGIDIDRTNIREALRIRKINQLDGDAFNALVVDLYALPFREQFDLVIISLVLEHLANDRSALKALSSILKDEGIMIIILPNALRLEFPQLFRLALRPTQLYPGHHREYKVNDVYSLIKSSHLVMEKRMGIYLDFPPFHIFSLPIRAFMRMHFSTKSRFFVYYALYRVYARFWTALESLLWYHSYDILIVAKKVASK